MELKVIKEAVALNELVCDSFTELPIECDVLLPDYCPDIMKLLKCCATPVLARATVEGGTVTAEGYALLELYYISDDMKMRCSEYKAPFQKTLELKTAPVNPAVSISFAVGYINCRAVNQRRVDIRGAVTMNTKVMAEKTESIVCDAEGGGIQLRKSEVETTCIAGCAEKQFTVREDLELSHGRPPIGAVIRKQAQPRCTECKVISNKIVMKGELSIDLFYLSAEDESPQLMQYSLPISQIIDLQGADENCKCDVRMRVLSTELQPKPDLDGETTVMSAEVTMCVAAKAYSRRTLAPVCDAYSTEYETASTERPVTAMRLLDMVDETHEYKEMLDLPDDVDEVMHLWCGADFTGGQLIDGAAELTGQLVLCMFAIQRDGSTVYFEKPVEFSHTVAIAQNPDNILADITMNPVSCDFSAQGGGKIEVRARIAIGGTLCGMEKNTVMSELAVDEAKPQQQDRSTALTIYFAQQGECVWDIAKHYHTAMAEVMEENSIDRETLPARTTLLIPLVV